MHKEVENRRPKLKRNKCECDTQHFEPFFDFVKFMDWPSSLFLRYFLPDGSLGSLSVFLQEILHWLLHEVKVELKRGKKVKLLHCKS